MGKCIECGKRTTAKKIFAIIGEYVCTKCIEANEKYKLISATQAARKKAISNETGELKACWKNPKINFGFLSPEVGDFNCPKEFTYVGLDDALLVRRVKPFAKWEVFETSRKRKRVAFLVPSNIAWRIKKEIREHIEKQRLAEYRKECRAKELAAQEEERRITKFEKQYPQIERALPDAANAMFNLNRYAKHIECSGYEQTTIYRLKNKLIAVLYQQGYAQTVWEHVVMAVMGSCRHCDGSGDCYESSCPLGCDENTGMCVVCDGWGSVELRPQRIFFCFQFEVGNQTYTWHQPDNVLDFRPEISAPPQNWDGVVSVKPINLEELDKAKSLVRWVLGKIPELKR